MFKTIVILLALFLMSVQTYAMFYNLNSFSGGGKLQLFVIVILSSLVFVKKKLVRYALILVNIYAFYMFFIGSFNMSSFPIIYLFTPLLSINFVSGLALHFIILTFYSLTFYLLLNKHGKSYFNDKHDPI
jgi:hypothetical protein